jgi:hypothetical protein
LDATEREVEMKKILNWLEFSPNPVAVYLGTVFAVTHLWLLAAREACREFRRVAHIEGQQ